MRLEYFEYLATLSRHALMSAASRELHVTPQALSVAIGRLERELGVKLVRTDNQGTRLNENGRYLVAKTQMFFDAIAEVRAQSQAAEGPCVVRVLADKAIKEDFAAELVRRLDEAAQPLALALDYCDLAEVKTRFLAGNYDLAICYRDQVGGVPVHTGNELVYEIMNSGYEPVDVVVMRDGKKVTLESVEFPTFSEAGATFGDVDFKPYAEAKTFGNIVKHAFFRSLSTIKMIFDMIRGRYGIEAVSGPIGITETVGTTVKNGGFMNLLYLFVVLAMNLGVVNLLPIPALDGGRLLFLIIEGIAGRPINRKVEGYINGAGLIILFTLMILISCKDIFTLIKK